MVQHEPDLRVAQPGDDLVAGQGTGVVDVPPAGMRLGLFLELFELARQQAGDVGGEVFEGGEHLEQALLLGQAADVDERVAPFLEGFVVALVRQAFLGEVLHHDRFVGGELLGYRRGCGDDCAQRPARDAFQHPGDPREWFLQPARDPGLVHDLQRDVLVDVVDDLLAAQPQRQPDPHQFGVVEVVDVGSFPQRPEEDGPRLAEDPVDAAARRAQPDHPHPRHLDVAVVAVDQGDVVARGRQGGALLVGDAGVVDVVDGREVTDPAHRAVPSPIER